MKITAATYNIQFGRGIDGAYDLDRTARDIAGADIVAFQEVAQHWQRNGYEDQALGLADRLGFHHVFGAGFDVAAGGPPGQPVPRGRRRTFGNMVASRWPIQTSRTFLLPKVALARFYDLQRCVVEAVVTTPAGRLRVYSLHLTHVSSGLRLPQVRTLLEIVDDAPENGAPWSGEPVPGWTEGPEESSLPEPALVMGDMNFTSDSPEYALVCGEKDPGLGRVVRRAGLRDAWVVAGNGEETGVSLRNEYLGELRIDHVFVTPSVARTVTGMRIDETARGSDHVPVFVELEVPTGGFGG